MSQPAISISSNDLTAAVLIPPVHKGFPCGQPNVNPQFSWDLSGIKAGNGQPFTTADVEKFEMFVYDLNAPGVAPRPNYVEPFFLHWLVTEIPPTITGVTQNQSWTGNETIYSTDYLSGDNLNGWNGPCAPASHVYQIFVIAHIKEFNIQDFYESGVDSPKTLKIRSAGFRFTDDPTNVYDNPPPPPPESVPCGELGCPEGSELIGDNCVETIITTPILYSTIYTVQQGMVATFYSEFGTHFFENVLQYDLPLSLDANGIIETSAVVSFPATNELTPDYTSTSTAWSSNGNNNEGRLNISSVWATNSGCPPGSDCNGTQNCPPFDRWIGFADCVIAPVTGKYCIGIAADNYVRFKLDGTLIFQALNNAQKNFKRWYVLEIDLVEGPHIIELEGRNASQCAAFGAEIYQSSAAVLQTFSTQAQVDNTIIFSTKNKIGEVFDIGEDSGASCPEGFAFDTCNTGECVQYQYSPIEETLCFYRIINCKDVNDTYLVLFASTETNPLYQNSVFALAGNQTYFEDKCFRLVGLEQAESADVIDVTVVTDYGINNCNACDPSEQVESCENPGTFEYISLAEGQSALTLNNIYEFDQLEGCYKYTGQKDTQPPLVVDVEITTDYESPDCIVCEPCVILKNCATDEEIIIRFDDSVEVPEIGAIIKINN